MFLIKINVTRQNRFQLVLTLQKSLNLLKRNSRHVSYKKHSYFCQDKFKIVKTGLDLLISPKKISKDISYKKIRNLSKQVKTWKNFPRTFLIKKNFYSSIQVWTCCILLEKKSPPTAFQFFDFLKSRVKVDWKKILQLMSPVTLLEKMRNRCSRPNKSINNL